ncbi:hypothetical protein Poli38472_012120 [Pythium oligandrum]|uniref:Hsp70-Hsp90 organising protein n=1 Tax=Pythium oligandrum TaxID=41045 RepID=A0A8K1FN68_PYTOL|nr:hypothetical protein Poli38472_012120 [Pythium oligandrum]|eukprot:TMW67004.1 hypothetical protein Poli38472_012120 [Pythium oligandrum]
MAEADAWKAKGNAALSAGNAQEAVDCYSKAIALNPNDHVFFSNRSAAYLSLSDAQHALEDAEACIKVKGDWAKGYSRKGAALHALRRYEEAIEAYEAGLKVEPGNAACASGVEEVKKVVLQSSSFNPFANAFGPDMFGKIATNPRLAPLLSDPELVAKLTELQRDPTKINVHLQDPRIMSVLGELMGLNVNMGEDADDVPPASSYAPKTKEPERPKTPEPEPMDEDLTEEEIQAREARKAAEEAKQKGNTFYKAKQFAEAVECYNEAIAKDPTNIAYYSNLAAVRLEMGEYDACIDDCKKAIEVGRSNRADYQLIAKVYVRIGNAWVKKGETAENLERAIEAYENAQVEFRTKDVEKKVKTLQQKLKKAKELAYIDPEKALAAKNEGNDAFKAGDFPKAVERYSEAIKRDPTSAVYYANRAAAYTKLTSFVEAKRDCEKALEIDDKYVKAYSRLGAIQFFMKEFHKARETYEKGLSLDPNNQECKDGLRSVIAKIQSGETDDERAAHGLADPEIQAILRDPVIQNVLNDFQTDPSAAQRHLQNAGIMAKLEKLIAAGVLQMK